MAPSNSISALSPKSVIHFMEDDENQAMRLEYPSIDKGTPVLEEKWTCVSVLAPTTTANTSLLSSPSRPRKRRLSLDFDEEAVEARSHTKGDSSKHERTKANRSRRRRVVNLRHGLVSDQTVEWLAAHNPRQTSNGDSSSSSNQCYPQSHHVQELALGPVFESAETVLTAIQHLPPSVTHLDLDLRNSLQVLPKALPILFDEERKQHLQSLSIRLYGDSGVEELAKWIHTNPRLTKLDLRGNRITDQGIIKLVARTLPSPRALDEANKKNNKWHLRHLNLSCNCIVNTQPLKELLTSPNCCLESLDLSFNWIGNEDVETLCEGLALNMSLKELNLLGCHRIDQRGLQRLLRCLSEENFALEQLHVPTMLDPSIFRLQEEIRHQLSLNRAGRALLLRHGNEEGRTRSLSGLWPHVLTKSRDDPSVLYYLLRQGSPQLVPASFQVDAPHANCNPV